MGESVNVSGTDASRLRIRALVDAANGQIKGISRLRDRLVIEELMSYIDTDIEWFDPPDQHCEFWDEERGAEFCRVLTRDGVSLYVVLFVQDLEIGEIVDKQDMELSVVRTDRQMLLARISTKELSRACK